MYVRTDGHIRVLLLQLLLLLLFRAWGGSSRLERVSVSVVVVHRPPVPNPTHQPTQPTTTAKT